MDNPMIEDMAPVAVSGEDVDRVLDVIQPVLEQFPREHVIVACMSLALVLMNPEIKPDDLAQGVEGVTEWVCTYLTSLEEQLPAEKLN